jgi:uncharacterized membrane protein HdeD (DUF308 family)
LPAVGATDRARKEETMLAALSIGWPLLLMRAVFAMSIGIVTFSVPAWSLYGLALLFATFALGDGGLALVLVVATRPERGAAALLSEALIRLGVGFYALFFPDWAALALLHVFAAWAIASGAAALAVAHALSSELEGEWPLPLAGVLSIACGLLPLVITPSLDARWIMGPYALLFGFTLLALSMRLRQLALEMAAQL